MDQESFKFSQALEDVLQKTRTELQLQTLSSPVAGDLCLGKRQQVYYVRLKSNSDGDLRSSNRVLDLAVSNSRYQMEIELLRQQLFRSEQDNQNSQEENKRLRQQLSDSQHGHTACVQQLEREKRDKERVWKDLHTQMAAGKRLVTDYSAAVEMAGEELRERVQKQQHLIEQVRDLEMLSRSFYPLLPSTEMVETFLYDILFLSDYCLLVSHLERCSSSQQVMPLWCHIRTCDKVCCEKCKILVNLYIGHVAHCQETDCQVPYCIHCKTLSQQLNLSTQDLATDQQFRKEVQSCLQRVIPQANEIDGVLLHHPGERDLHHRRQMTPALQMLLRFFASHVRPVQELVVWCFRHHKEWSSLSHEKYCPACRIFQHILRRCGTCRTDMCETCVMACCACAKHTVVCHNESCTFLFCHTQFNFKTSVRHRDTTSPSRVLLTLFRKCVHQICYET